MLAFAGILMSLTNPPKPPSEVSAIDKIV